MYKKSFNVADYGMCFLQDLVFEIKDHKELVVDLDNDLIKLYRKGNEIDLSIENCSLISIRTNWIGNLCNV